ncbi:hypothetical protein ACHAPT_002263 [Fusarium lateritium]
MLATCSGPQRGTYSINVLHMAVRRPLNLGDEGMSEESGVPPALPLDQPTSMSYFLERLRLAETMRAVIDRNPLMASDTSTLSYSHVLEVDSAIAGFLQETSQLSPLEAGDGSVSPRLRQDHFQNIAVQQYSLYFLGHGQRCRLHLPYLARSAVEPAYEHSRRVALQSARLMTDAEIKLKAGNQTISSAQFRLGSVLLGCFSAVAVLALDLCLASHEEVPSKQQEVKQAWTVLDNAQAQLPITRGGIQMLEAMMRKHNVWFGAEASSSSQRLPTAQPHHDAEKAGQGNGEDMPSPELNMHGEHAALPMDLDGLDFQSDEVDWDNLRWILDMPFL